MIILLLIIYFVRSFVLFKIVISHLCNTSAMASFYNLLYFTYCRSTSIRSLLYPHCTKMFLLFILMNCATLSSILWCPMYNLKLCIEYNNNNNNSTFSIFLEIKMVRGSTTMKTAIAP